MVAAPALGFTFLSGGLRELTVPVQLWRAEDDRVLPFPGYADAVRRALPLPPEYHVVPGAGHFDFLAPCNEELAAIDARICASAAGLDRIAFHERFDDEVVAFFRRSLRRGRAAARGGRAQVEARAALRIAAEGGDAMDPRHPCRES